MDRPEEYHVVETSEIRETKDGTSRMQFAAGTRVPLSTAAEYGLVESAPVLVVREEKPDVAENDEPVDFGQRSEQTAPENRAEGAAPQNRGRKS